MIESLFAGCNVSLRGDVRVWHGAGGSLAGRAKQTGACAEHTTSRAFDVAHQSTSRVADRSQRRVRIDIGVGVRLLT